jgi:hypothetical protein
MTPASIEQLEPVWNALSVRTGIRLAGARLDAQNPLCAKLLARLRAVGITQLLWSYPVSVDGVGLAVKLSVC